MVLCLCNHALRLRILTSPGILLHPTHLHSILRHSDERLAAAGIDPTTLLPRLRPSTTKGWPSEVAAGGQASGSDTNPVVDTQGFTARSQAQGEAAKKRCLATLEGWAPSFLDIVAATPPERVVEHGLFIRSANTMSPAAYGAGRVVVLGDAAHPVRPTGGWFEWEPTWQHLKCSAEPNLRWWYAGWGGVG